MNDQPPCRDIGNPEKRIEGGYTMRKQTVFVASILTILAVFVIAAVARAEPADQQAKIARAMQAAPESISKNATIADVSIGVGLGPLIGIQKGPL